MQHHPPFAPTLTGAPPLGADLVRITTGPWAGWFHYKAIPHDMHVGPFYVTYDGEAVICGFTPEPKNLNLFGIVHGGTLMSFADFALSMIARGHERDVSTLTVTFSSEFLGPAPADTPLLARGEITGGGRNLGFVRGIIYSGEKAVMAFSSTVKRLRSPEAGA